MSHAAKGEGDSTGAASCHSGILGSLDERGLWVAVTCGVVLIAIIARVGIDSAHVYPPGTDAGYYPVQARTLLANGRLMYDDMPLVFWLDAAIANVLTKCGWQLDDAVLLASRLLNCVTLPFAAAGVMALGCLRAGGRRQALPGCTAAALIAVASAPAILLIGFHKTSLGLVWFTGAVWACRRAMENGCGRDWALLFGFVALSLLTHFGVFATTIFTVGLALGIRYRRTRGQPVTRGAWLAAVGGLVSLGGLLAYFDPRRALTLLKAPVLLFATGILGGGFFLDRTGWLIAASVLVVLAVGVYQLFRERAALGPVDTAVVAAAVGTCALLVFPKTSNYMSRLVLMAPIPAAFIVAFVMARRAVRGAWPLPGYLLLGLAVVLTVTSPFAVPPPVLNDKAARELRGMQALIADPAHTLVLAPHGLEWFAGHFLHTPVREAGYGPLREADLRTAASARYTRVLFLRYRSRVAVRAESGHLTMLQIHSGDAFEAFEVIPPRTR